MVGVPPYFQRFALYFGTGAKRLQFSIVEKAGAAYNLVGKVSSADAAAGKWHHLMCTWKNINSGSTDSEMRVYFNGDLCGEITGKAIGNITEINEFLYIGSGAANGGYKNHQARCMLDEVIILNKALEITDLKSYLADQKAASGTGPSGSTAPAKQTAVSVLQKKADVPSSNPVSDPVIVLNKGIGGQNTRQGLVRFETDVLQEKPRFLILYFGMNDAVNSGNSVPLDEYKGNLEKMTGLATDAGIIPVLVTINPAIEPYLLSRHKKEFFENETPNEKINTYSAAVREVSRVQKTALVDLNTICRERGEPKEDSSSIIRNKANVKIADGVHLTAEGYRLLAEEVYKKLKDQIQKGDTIVCFGDSLTFGSGMAGAGTASGETYPAFLKEIIIKDISSEAKSKQKTVPGSTSLTNTVMGLTLMPPAAGGGISSIKNSRGTEFINGIAEPSLWKIELRAIPTAYSKTPVLVMLSLDPEQGDGATSKDDSGIEAPETFIISSAETDAKTGIDSSPGQITYKWNNISVKDEKNALDVRITVSLKPGDPFARFKGSFNNRSKKYTVFYLYTPQLSGIYPSDGNIEADRLAIPAFDGRLIANPAANGILGKPNRLQPNRSGHSMQFDAWYHNGEGLFLGCQDGMENVKRYWIAADMNRGVSWSLVHVPNNMKKVPQEWSVPYDTVIRCFDGDWYDACQIYRSWAVKQPNTSEGPILTRKSIPEWFKNIDEWILWGSQHKNQEQIFNEKTSTLFKGLNVGLLIDGWGQGSGSGAGVINGPDVFPTIEADHYVFKKAGENGYPLCGYIQGISWETNSESFIKYNGIDNTVRNFYDQRVATTWGHKGGRMFGIGYPGDAWIQALGDNVVRMAKETPFAVAYLDSGSHGGTYLNFNPLCSTDSGGGTGYIHGQYRLVRETRARARKYNSNFCFTAESFWEGSIAVLDGQMSCNTTYQFLKEGSVTAIPLAHTVYHDYNIFYSAWVNKTDLVQENAQGYVAKFAQIFVWGVKPAWNIPNLFLVYDNHEIAYESSRKRYDAYAASKKYLLYGKMLREPEMVSDPAPVKFKWGISWGTSVYDISMPSVISSVWKAADGSLGLVLYNISPSERRAEILLDDPEYGINAKGALNITPVYPAGFRQNMKKAKNGGVTISCTIAKQSPVVLEIK